MNSRNMKSPRSLLVPSMAVACGLITLSGAAYWAQQDDQTSSASASLQDGERALVVTGVVNDDDDHATKSSTMSNVVRAFATTADGDEKSKRIEITDENGDVTVVVNGKKIDGSRIKKEDGRIVILDENGDPIDEIVMWSNDAFRGALTLEGLDGELKELIGQWRTNEAKPFDMSFGFEATPPKTMIGFQMDEPSDAICSHLHISPQASIIVKRVHKGMPADKAGLKAHDIIIRIDGREPANGDALHKALNEKSEGDTLKLEIIHKGERKQVEVELEAFDPGKLGWIDATGNVQFSTDDMPRVRTLIAPGQHGTGHGNAFTFRTAPDGKNITKDMQIYVTPDGATPFGNTNVKRFGTTPDGQTYQVIIEGVREELDDALKDMRLMIPDEFNDKLDVRIREIIENSQKDMGNTFEQHFRKLESAHDQDASFNDRIDVIHERLDHVERLLKEILSDLKKN